MASRRPAPDYEPDIAARTALLFAVVWAVLASGVAVLEGARLLFPDALSFGVLTYGKLRAVHDQFLVFGWLSTAGFAAVFGVLPRLAGIRLHNEILGATSVFGWTVVLLAGGAGLVLGFNQGRPLAELPIALDVALVVLTVTVAYNALMTVARRRERTLYVSAWYLLAALAWLPVVLAVGNVPVLSGARDAIVSGFYLNAIDFLWLAPVGLGVAYYVVPRSTGGELASRQLALAGFWTLAFAGGWAGGRFNVLGPVPAYLQAIGVVMTVVLLVPVLSAASNLFRTGRGLWGLMGDDVGLRFAGVGVAGLAAWTALTAVSAFPSVSAAVGLTSWDAGLRYLGFYGVFSSLAFAAVYHLYPRLVGRTWWSPSLSSLHFWGTLGGALVAGGATMAAGLVQAGARLAGDGATVSLRGFWWVRLLGLFVVADAQLVLAYNAFKTSRAGEPMTAAEPAGVPVGSAV